MASYRKKICLIGDFAVGKTSLVKRYVDQVFSEDYTTTVGVSIVTKEVQLDRDSMVKLIIWDIAGADKLTTVSHAYLQGANGYVLVADGTRRQTGWRRESRTPSDRRPRRGRSSSPSRRRRGQFPPAGRLRRPAIRSS